MKKLLWIVAVILLICVVGPAFADDTVAEAVEPVAEAVQPASEGGSFGKAIWTFLNSSVGVSCVVFVLSVLAGKVFTAKPKWKQYVLKYGPQIMQAVKVAEKKIPNDTENSGLSKLDEALKYLVEIEPKLKGAVEGDLKQALTAVHTKAEADGNLK